MAVLWDGRPKSSIAITSSAARATRTPPGTGRSPPRVEDQLVSTFREVDVPLDEKLLQSLACRKGEEGTDCVDEVHVVTCRPLLPITNLDTISIIVRNLVRPRVHHERQCAFPLSAELSQLAQVSGSRLQAPLAEFLHQPAVDGPHRAPKFIRTAWRMRHYQSIACAAVDPTQQGTEHGVAPDKGSQTCAFCRAELRHSRHATLPPLGTIHCVIPQ